MTRVLVTNDDGIDAPGLQALARAALNAGLDVTVAAPATQSSGSSASIMAMESDGRIAVERRSFPEMADVPAFAVHGGPGLIVLIAARGAFGEPPDIVLSGVNHGANVGRAILHSGTVGAALTGALNGAWALAVSLDVGMSPDSYHWDAASETVVALLPELTSRARGTTFNINVPNNPHNRGIREVPLAPFGIVQMALTESADRYVRLAVEELPLVAEDGSDAALLRAGWVTVTGIDSITEVALDLKAGQPAEGIETSPVAAPSPASAGSGTR
jgi:5'-nucleotidase